MSKRFQLTPLQFAGKLHYINKSKELCITLLNQLIKLANEELRFFIINKEIIESILNMLMQENGGTPMLWMWRMQR